MKNNLISSIASWKSAALLGLVALIATVAFSGVLSTTKTAEAAEGDLAINAGADATPGSTVDVTFEAGGSQRYVTFSITSASTSTASFVSGGGQSVLCRDAIAAGSTCDSDTDASDMTLKLKVADDAKDGIIVISANNIVGTNGVAVLTVSSTNVPTKVTVKADSSSISSATGTSTTITATVTNAKSAGISGLTVNMKTTLGTLGSGVQACSDSTNADGVITCTLTTTNLPGVATVTATQGALSDTTDVTFFGPPANISVVPEQGAIQIDGGKTFLVVTVTDAAGSPVANHNFSEGDVTEGPATVANKVSTALNVPKDVNANGSHADKGDIPHCDNTTPATPTDVTDPSEYGQGGTNAAGKCVIQVTASKGTTPAGDTTRGEHTVKVVLSATKSATATINVGGPPSSMTDDAPDRIDALHEQKVNVTVFDDAGVPVGVTDFTATKVAGDGILIGITPTTTDGKASFTYIAGLSGTAIIRLTAGSGAGTITHGVQIAVGEAAPDPTWNADLVSGWNNLTWMGEDGASIADHIPDSVGAVYVWNVNSQSWDAFFPDGADVPGANQISTLSNGTAYWISN